MIIAVDYDGTLKIGNEMNIALINKLMHEQRRGNVVILWTCRHGKRLQEACSELMNVGFRPNYVNCNSEETIRRLGYDPRKVLADIYIDDKAVR